MIPAVELETTGLSLGKKSIGMRSQSYICWVVGWLKSNLL